MILVTGGTGIVGSRVVRGLLENQQPVRIFARGLSDWKDNPMPQFRKMGVDVITGDVRNSDKLAAAMEGCTAVVHCASIMRAGPGDDIDAINVEPTKKLLSLAAGAGVQRFIYVGCLGAAQYSGSRYLRSKWEAEAAVRASSFYWTIFRPSLIFAGGSQLMRSVEFWASRAPFLMVVGSGLNRIQPVSADDVASCIVQSIYNRDTVGKSFDLVGPQSYSFTELLDMAAKFVSPYNKPVFKVPSALGFGLAQILGKLNPRNPMDDEVMKVLTSEFVGDKQIMQENFEVNMMRLESYFRQIGDK